MPEETQKLPFERHRQRVRGVEPVVQAAAELLRKRETEAENVLWQAIRNRQCAGLKFRRQHAVGPVILDFYCPEKRLVIELDGAVHDSVDAREHDRLRTEHLNRYDYHVLRFRNEEVLSSLPFILSRIAAAAEEPTPPAEPYASESLSPPLPSAQRKHLGEGAGG